MRIVLLLVVALGLAVVPGGGVSAGEGGTQAGAPDRVSQALANARGLEGGARIVALSEVFLDAPYQAGTLNRPDEVEQLVVNLRCFDCFTLLDVVEALRRAEASADFPEQLRQVRYRDGEIGFATRNHFFSDWVSRAGTPLRDVTEAVGLDRAVVQTKHLNRKADGELWVPTLPVTPRQVAYIPSDQLDQAILDRLRPGDYAGVYSDLEGLDVSHTGIIVLQGDQVLLRHASSRSDTGRVVDEDLLAYLAGKPGLVVYRLR